MKSAFLLVLLLAALTVAMTIGSAPDHGAALDSTATPFNATDQLVDVTGPHAFIHPGPGDARGPCPGLNALANHGYISRNGVTNHDELIKALVNVYALDLNMAEVILWPALAASGSADMWTLSIGGHHPRTEENNSFALQVPTRGLSGTHLSVESDASPTRSDLYDPRNGGHPDDTNLQINLFNQLFDKEAYYSETPHDYNLDIVGLHKFERTMDSVKNNPDMFVSPTNAILGSMASHVLMPRLFGNHSDVDPDGRLDGTTLKSFFGVSLDPEKGNQYSKGSERIPENWYRRPSNRPYTGESLNADIVSVYQKFPDLINKYFVGGNADGKADNWHGLDIGKLTGGNYTVDSILNDPMGAVCFAIASAPAFMAPYIQPLYQDYGRVFDLLDQKIIPIVKPLNCPLWFHLDSTIFDGLRGYNRSFTEFGSTLS